jgi:presenilin-like A22 family membrane protease
LKHKLSITLTLLGLFLLAQIVGILVINNYNPANPDSKQLPFGLDDTEGEGGPVTFIIALILAFGVFFFLMKYNMKFVIKAWFFFVILLALSVTLYAFINSTLIRTSILVLIIALPLTILKIFRPSMLIHNGTEILIYPGIAVIIAPLISVPGIIIILILIAIYDAWAVWKSGLMQKMAKYQMEEVKIFGGLLIPHMDKKTRERIKKLKQKYKKAELKEKFKNKKFKINIAVLGGGDIVFPIIAMAVFMEAFPETALFGINGLIPALFILAGSFIALAHLFTITKKDKAYPAMPWISSGALLGMLVWWLTTVIF